jgi:Putative regulator of cell autolysis
MKDSFIHKLWFSVIVSIFFLLVLFFSIYYVDRAMNDNVRAMNRKVIAEVCDNQYSEVSYEFNKSIEVSALILNFFKNDFINGLNSNSSMFFELDNKLAEFWLIDSVNCCGHRWTKERVQKYSSGPEIKKAINCGKNFNLINIDGNLIWSVIYCLERDNSKYYLGFNYPLNNIFSVFSKNKNLSSYIIVTDTIGNIIMHPDSTLLGNYIGINYKTKIDSLIKSNSTISYTTTSSYLNLLVERKLYSMPLLDGKFIVSINIPHISFHHLIINFHKYAILLGVIIALCFIIIAFIFQNRWRNEYNRRVNAEREAVELRLSNVIKQINPHFLFNSLNSLYALIGKNDVLAREFVVRLSKVYRFVLEQESVSITTVEDELGFTKEYFFLQKIRFRDLVEFNIDVSNSILMLKIPTFSVHSIVENALKHNIITPDNHLIIKIYSTSDYLVIENNYTPLDNSENSFGIGIERLNVIYKQYTSNKVIINLDNGLFVCKLPFI